jgi:hypothetical protein
MSCADVHKVVVFYQNNIKISLSISTHILNIVYAIRVCEIAINDQIKNGHCLAIGVHGLHGVHVLQIEPWKYICLNCLCNLLIHPCCHWLCVYYENVLSSCTLSVSEVNKVFVFVLSWSKNYLHERKTKSSHQRFVVIIV